MLLPHLCGKRDCVRKLGMQAAELGSDECCGELMSEGGEEGELADERRDGGGGRVTGGEEERDARSWNTLRGERKGSRIRGNKDE